MICVDVLVRVGALALCLDLHPVTFFLMVVLFFLCSGDELAVGRGGNALRFCVCAV